MSAPAATTKRGPAAGVEDPPLDALLSVAPLLAFEAPLLDEPPQPAATMKANAANPTVRIDLITAVLSCVRGALPQADYRFEPTRRELTNSFAAVLTARAREHTPSPSLITSELEVPMRASNTAPSRPSRPVTSAAR